jgi:hypothetical protein
MWRGDANAPPPAPEATRLSLMFAQLARHGAVDEPLVYADAAADVMLERLRTFDGVLVWIDPLSGGEDRSKLDPILREAAAGGVWVSAHPDVIMKMGVKEVLYRTRSLSWGADTDLYVSADDFRRRFPARLAAAGPRVLKQNRGNGGQGIWKVELIASGGPSLGLVRVLHAQRGSWPEELLVGAFMDRCATYFDGDGRIVDQAFQPRLPEGMTRCYLSGGEVVGYGHQLIKALIEPPPDVELETWLPGPRIMHPPDAPPFQALRRRLETEWVPQMQALLDIGPNHLPALWDADFLLGPKTAHGADTHLLCEINDSAAPRAAEFALRQVRAAMADRQAT